MLGAALASIYLFMAWDSPPDMSNAGPRTLLNFYLTVPPYYFAAGQCSWPAG
jgi:hypothetical protein